MNRERVVILYDKKNARSLSNKTGCVFVKGELPRLYIGETRCDMKISLSAAVSRQVLQQMPVLSGSDLAAIRKELEKSDRNKCLLVCFGGKKADYALLTEENKDAGAWMFARLAMGVRYFVDFRWDLSSSGGWCKGTISPEEKFIEIIEKPVKPEVKSNANVAVPKPNNNKKTDK